MGFKLEIGGRLYEAVDFNVIEAATPLAAGDSTGQVGTISLTIPYPDPELQPNHPITIFGPQILSGESVRLVDTRKGFTLGEIVSASNSLTAGNIQIQANSRLGELNVYNVQAQPFVGTLQDAFEQYLELANVDHDFFVDPEIAGTPVVFPGWNGELWFHLKQMAAAIDCDISLVSGIILLRPVRERVATRGRDIERSFTLSGGSLAQNIEVYYYNNRPITNELVYPPGGWSEDVTVINVNAGETIEEVLELSASVSSISQPVMQTFVAKSHRNSSVFTVVGDDGLPITPAAWNSNGGRLRVDINPDTTSLTVHITAPTGLPNRDGAEIGVYSVSLSDTGSTGRYSTLRIVGSGVAFDKKSKLIPTGIGPSETATEIGVSIDNPFFSSLDDVNRSGSRAVRAYNGTAMAINGSVVAINQLGDSGVATTRTYGFVQDLHAGKTYNDVQSEWGGFSYQQIFTDLNEPLENEFQNQVFGNVNGARVWDKQSKRWYRIRTGTLVPSNIQFEAEDDLTHEDVIEYYNDRVGMTYGDLQGFLTGYTYKQVDLMGLYAPGGV